MHFTHGNHSYFFSGNTTAHASAKVNWLEARNLCREYCMDLVSIEAPAEDELIREYIRKGERRLLPV